MGFSLCDNLRPKCFALRRWVAKQVGMDPFPLLVEIATTNSEAVNLPENIKSQVRDHLADDMHIRAEVEAPLDLL